MKILVIATVLAFGAGVAVAADMKDMEMKDMSPTRMSRDDKTTRHVAKGTVKSGNASGGSVTLAHDPVKSLNWPAMTMAFKVRDKVLFDKLAAGKTVEVQFEQRGKDYVITGVK